MSDGESVGSVGGTERMLFDYQPEAASRYDGDHECQYPDCEETAEWLIDCKASGYTGGTAFFCCQSCSRENLIYARENELYKTEIDTSIAEIIPEGEVEKVHDLRADTDRSNSGDAE